MCLFKHTCCLGHLVGRAVGSICNLLYSTLLVFRAISLSLSLVSVLFLELLGPELHLYRELWRESIAPFQPHRLMHLRPGHPLPVLEADRVAYMPPNPRKQRGNCHGYCDNQTVVCTPEITETKKKTARDTAFDQVRTLK